MPGYRRDSGSPSELASTSAMVSSRTAISTATVSISQRGWRRSPSPVASAFRKDAFRQVRGKIDAEFDDIGEQSLKNITRPLRVYRIPITLTLPTPSARAPSLSRIAGEGEPRRASDAVGEGKQGLASARQTVDRG